MSSISMPVGRRSFMISAAAGILASQAVAQPSDSANEHAGDVFPLLNCPVCDTMLGGTDIIIREENREVRVCDRECEKGLQGSYFTFLKAIDEQIAIEQANDYPLTKCLIDGVPLKGKGPVEFVFRNRLFRVCCDDCRFKIEEQAAKYFAELNMAVVKEQRAAYPIETCLVSKKPLGQKAVDHVCANMLVRLADGNQIARFNKSPGRYLENLRELRKKKEKAG